jgi:hypothetical protein
MENPSPDAEQPASLRIILFQTEDKRQRNGRIHHLCDSMQQPGKTNPAVNLDQSCPKTLFGVYTW